MTDYKIALKLMRLLGTSSLEINTITDILDISSQQLHNILNKASKLIILDKGVVSKTKKMNFYNLQKLYHDSKHQGSELIGPELKVEYHSKRKCRKCNGKLDYSRWFTCTSCEFTLPSINEDFIFLNSESRASELTIMEI